MKPTSLYRIVAVAGVLSLFISYVGIWNRFVNDPVQRTGSDFIAFYSAGRVAQNQGISAVYDPRLQQMIQQEEVGFTLAPGQVLLYNHLPFLVPLLQIIVSENYVASLHRWVLLLMILYILSVVVLSTISRQSGFNQESTVLTAVGALLFLPVFFSLMNGQDTAILFLGASIWMYGLLSGKEYLAGLGLSLTTVRPHIALILAVPMFFRSTRVFAAFLVGSLLLVLISISILGRAGVQDFIEILFLSAGGEWYGMKESAMYNLIGLLSRTTPWLPAATIRWLGWILYAGAMVVLSLLWLRTREARNGLIGLSIIFALFFVPHLHFHDLALLLIPIYNVVQTHQDSGNVRPSFLALIPVALSLVLLLSNISPFLQYTIPYLIMLLLAIYSYPAARTFFTRPHQS
ncbi:MAG TPA: glycosyltransferase family 87 protein [Anaerolineales bacterium]|nr:glycosyltransferase family 87 protein [Anaerolineales bacterium]